MRPATGHNKGSPAQAAVTGWFGDRQWFQEFYLPGRVVVLVGRCFTIGALLSDRSRVAMIRAAP